MNASLPICFYCKHYNERKCSYFGVEIPDLIFTAGFNHKTPIKNEKILFEFQDNITKDERDRIDYTYLDKQRAKQVLKNLKGMII